MVDSPLRWHGGKHYLAKYIIERMPPRQSLLHPNGWVHYVEPYAGSLAVLLANDPWGISEVANDLNENLTNFWRVMQEEESFQAFRRIVEAVPLSEAEWNQAEEGLRSEDPVRRAVAFFIRCRQSYAGRCDQFTYFSKNRTRRFMNCEVSAWWSAVDGLVAVHERLRRVAILCRPALEVIQREDSPHTLFYLDPPYVPETRASPRVYDKEMSYEDHEELLDTISNVKGKVMISGYHHPLYLERLRDWQRYEFNIANHASSSRTKRRMTEVLWCNFS